MDSDYHGNKKKSDTPKKIALIILKFELWFYHTVMGPKGADGKANGIDPDQTAPSGTV